VLQCVEVCLYVVSLMQCLVWGYVCVCVCVCVCVSCMWLSYDVVKGLECRVYCFGCSV